MLTITTTIGSPSSTDVASSWLGHLEAAVAVDADDRRVRPRRLRADRGRHAVAHRPEAARGDERARPVAEQVLHRPHLVLADAGRPDDVVALGGERPAASRARVCGLSSSSPSGRSGAGTRRASRRSARSHGSVRPAPPDALADARRRARRAPASAARRRGCRRGGACRSRPSRCRGGRRSRPARTPTSLPVTRSSKRAPTATSRSALFIAQFDHFGPCIPGQPKKSSWVSGNAPFAISVVTTGRRPASASSRSSSQSPRALSDAAADVEHGLLRGGDRAGRRARSGAGARGAAASSRAGRPRPGTRTRARPPGCRAARRRAPGRSGPCGRRGTPP